MAWFGVFARGAKGAPLRLLGRDLSVAFLGHLAKGGFGWLTFLVLMRRWHPDDFGRFALAESVYLMAFQLSEFGLSTAITRFVSKGIRNDDQELASEYLRAVFWAKLLTAGLVFVIGWLAAPLYAEAILERASLAPFMRIGLLGVFGLHLSHFYQAYLGARLEFHLNAVFVASGPFLTLGGVAIAWWNEAVTVEVVMWIYAISPTLTCVMAFVVLPHDFLKQRSPIAKSLLNVWQFSRWVYATNTLGAVRFRLNSVFLSRLGESHIRDVGLYNFADKLASTLTLLTATVMTVMMPRVSHLVSQSELKDVLRSTHRWLLLIPVLAFASLAAAPFISNVAPRYVEATPIFVILFVSILFSLAAMPSRAVVYSINRPQVETVVEMIAVVLTLGLGFVLVQHYQAKGAAIAMLVQRAVSASLLIGWVQLRVFHATPEQFERHDASGTVV